MKNNTHNLLINKKSFRTSPFPYFFGILGIVFLFASISIDPSCDCIEYPCPFWLRALAGGIGFLLIIGIARALTCNFQYGSRVDVETKILYWWHGCAPITENSIDLKHIHTIKVNTSSDSSSIVLLDSNNKPIYILASCIPSPYLDWAFVLQKSSPNIQVIEED